MTNSSNLAPPLLFASSEDSRHRRPFSSAAFSALFFLAATTVSAQQGGSTAPPVGDVFSSGGGGNSGDVYSDQFSSNCEKGNNSPYAGMDPLVCYGVMAPADSRGQCTLGGMEVLKQEGNTCYFCQKLNPPTNGVIIPLDDIAQADNQGFKCGVDQADPNCMAICTRDRGSGPYVPPPGTKLGTPPGGKGITYVPGPAKPKPTPIDEPTRPNIPALDKAMANCLSAKLPYSFPQTVSPNFLQMARDYFGPKSEQNTPYAQLSPISQIFLEETAMSLQTQAAHDALYGGNPYNTFDSNYYMVGWLERCLITAGLRPLTNDDSPNAPWQLYANYEGGVSLKSDEVQYFLKGYTTVDMPPPPLKPPQPPSILPGLIPLKPGQ
jgi:hypothetical protein